MYIDYQIDNSESVRINYYEELLQKKICEKVTKLKIYRKLIGTKIQKFTKLRKVKLIKVQDTINIRNHLEKLENLYLDDCNINSYDIYNTINNPYMKTVRIINCNIQTLQFINLSLFENLLSLDVSNNRLTHIPNYLYKCEKLTYCNLSNNKIQNIPNDFTRLYSLKNLDLSNNIIRYFSIQELPNNIEILDISFNQIYCDKMIVDLEYCKKININGNYFIRDIIFRSNNFEEIYCLDSKFENILFESEEYNFLNILLINLNEDINRKSKYINIFEKKIQNSKVIQLHGQSLYKLFDDIYL